MSVPSDDTLSDDLLLQAQRALGDRLRLLRAERQMTQDAAAAYAGVHQSEWSRLEAGEVDPRLSWLLRAQHLFGIESLETLFGPLPSQRLLGVNGGSTAHESASSD
jgi:transcriptional regulator with XRE-family HTH domain